MLNNSERPFVTLEAFNARFGGLHIDVRVTGGDLEMDQSQLIEAIRTHLEGVPGVVDVRATRYELAEEVIEPPASTPEQPTEPSTGETGTNQ